MPNSYAYLIDCANAVLERCQFVIKIRRPNTNVLKSNSDLQLQILDVFRSEQLPEKLYFRLTKLLYKLRSVEIEMQFILLRDILSLARLDMEVDNRGACESIYNKIRFNCNLLQEKINELDKYQEEFIKNDSSGKDLYCSEKHKKMLNKFLSKLIPLQRFLDPLPTPFNYSLKDVVSVACLSSFVQEQNDLDTFFSQVKDEVANDNFSFFSRKFKKESKAIMDQKNSVAYP